MESYEARPSSKKLYVHDFPVPFPTVKELTQHSKQNFASHCVIATGIYGDEDGITFTVEGQGGDQWVSFHHQSKPHGRSLPATWLAMLTPIRH